MADWNTLRHGSLSSLALVTSNILCPSLRSCMQIRIQPAVSLGVSPSLFKSARNQSREQGPCDGS